MQLCTGAILTVASIRDRRANASADAGEGEVGWKVFRRYESFPRIHVLVTEL